MKIDGSDDTEIELVGLKQVDYMGNPTTTKGPCWPKAHKKLSSNPGRMSIIKYHMNACILQSRIPHMKQTLTHRKTVGRELYTIQSDERSNIKKGMRERGE